MCILASTHALSLLWIEPRVSATSLLYRYVDQLAVLRDELVKRIRAEFGSAYDESNIMITATHTRDSGGITHQSLYNITTLGFHQDTFNAQVDGSLKAIRQATKDRHWTT